MKLKTSELQGAVLDWAVAKCEGKTKLYQIRRGDSRVIDTDHPEYFEQYKRQHDEYSTDWALAGPIIERERIGFKYTGTAMEFVAWVNGELSTMHDQYGPTPLIAAMRCYVASKFGDDLVLFKVEVPDELA
jgi:hypothetical protein